VIDRIVDGEHAVLLVGDAEVEHIVPAHRLPAEAVPGTWLRVRFDDAELVEIAVDARETEEVRARISSKMERLRQRKRRGRDGG
jgi:hypothetical protein